MTAPMIDDVEHYLRHKAANKAVEDADRFGWTEVRQGVFLDTAERMSSLGDEAQKAPYWMTTQDGTPPQPIAGPRDERLRAMMDVDRELTFAAHQIEEHDAQERMEMSRLGTARRGVVSMGFELADVEEMSARRRGRAM